MISIETAQEISGIGYWELDFVNQTLVWSNQVYKIFGVDPKNFIPTEELFLAFVHPDDRAKIHSAFAEAIKFKRPYEIQHRIVLDNGEVRYVIEKSGSILDASGTAIKSYGSVQDVTDSVLARMKLEASQNKFMAISNQTTEGITVADLNGKYVFVNPAFCKMSGYSEAELLEMTVYDMKANSQNHTSFNNSKEQLEGKPIRVKLQKKNGVEFITEIIGDIIEVEGEQLVLGTIRDVSEQVKSEAIINKLNKHLESTVEERTRQLNETIQNLSEEVEHRTQVEEKLKDSLAVKEILFREITHRVKNNMQIISSLINLQMNHLDKDSCEVLAQIIHRIHAMALIHETLYKTDEFKAIQFNHYLNSLISYIRKSYSFENFIINLNVQESQLPLDVGTSLGMIIIELVINSIKHAFSNSDKNGVIDICFKERKPKHYHLTIADNGGGFPDGVDFRNSDSLGLQLVTSLVDQISGEIELKRNNGAIFEISFVAEPVLRK